ncbi:MAG: hypothetical protein ACLPZY_19690 [Terracidiphilus sp.]
MAIELEQLSERIEECYEFTLSYAARGFAGDDSNEQTRQVRDHLTRAVEAMRGLEAACREVVAREQLEPKEKYVAFFAVMQRDAEGAIAAMELVLAQTAIGSQLIDNLNASIHLRALLADLFLLTEILEVRQKAAQRTAS